MFILSYTQQPNNAFPNLDDYPFKYQTTLFPHRKIMPYNIQRF